MFQVGSGPGKRVIVDGMNVIGARPDGWWRDRPRAMRKLVDELDRYGRARGDQVVVVFDGPRSPRSPRSRKHVDVEFTPDSRPDAADDAIAMIVAADPDPASLTVVTSDSRLAGRVRAHGAAVSGARSFRRLLDGVSPSASRAG
jgi:predicted RNA-binding protein with PIN domain